MSKEPPFPMPVEPPGAAFTRILYSTAKSVRVAMGLVGDSGFKGMKDLREFHKRVDAAMSAVFGE